MDVHYRDGEDVLIVNDEEFGQRVQDAGDDDRDDQLIVAAGAVNVLDKEEGHRNLQDVQEDDVRDG